MEDFNFAVVIPTYNHGSRIVDVLSSVIPLACPVFVVDDGSTDGTGEILAGIKGIKLLRHPVNLGKGAALLTGFSEAVKTCSHAVSIDADGQHDPGDIVLLLQAAKENHRALIVGERQGMDQSHVPWTSKFGRKFSNFWVQVSGGPQVRDSQSGFRVYPLAEILALDVRARRFQYEVEVLVRASRKGLPVLETPVGVVYQKGADRISHFHPWHDFIRNSKTFSRLILERLFAIFRGGR